MATDMRKADGAIRTGIGSGDHTPILPADIRKVPWIEGNKVVNTKLRVSKQRSYYPIGKAERAIACYASGHFRQTFGQGGGSQRSVIEQRKTALTFES
jgi:hypothetical protein